MKRHLRDYINRIQSHSKSLDNFAILCEQPWITKIDEDNSRCVFIFRRDNKELIMSLNGKIEKAKWDYIPAMNSLLIEREKETILYNQGFFDESIMILKQDGSNDFQLFANENKITSTIDKLMDEVEQKYLKPTRYSDDNSREKAENDEKNVQIEAIAIAILVLTFFIAFLLDKYAK